MEDGKFLHAIRSDKWNNTVRCIKAEAPLLNYCRWKKILLFDVRKAGTIFVLVLDPLQLYFFLIPSAGYSVGSQWVNWSSLVVVTVALVHKSAGGCLLHSASIQISGCRLSNVKMNRSDLLCFCHFSASNCSTIASNYHIVQYGKWEASERELRFSQQWNDDTQEGFPIVRTSAFEFEYIIRI